MKKFLFAAFVFCSLQLHSQYVDGIPMSDIDYEFVQLWYTPGETQKIIFDYGQGDTTLFEKTNLTDSSGKEIKPVSQVPLINKMIDMGYDIISINVVHTDNTNTFVYSFRKKEK